MAKDKKQEQQNGEQPKKKSKLLLLIILVLALGLIGGGGFFAYKKFFAKEKEPKVEQTAEEKKAKDKKEEKEGEGQTPTLQTKLIQIPTIIVNLADPLGKRYLKISIELEVKGKEPEKLIEDKMPMIKDTLILLLSSKTFDELSTLEQKYKLKMDIAKRLNQILEKPIVTNVFFTEFLVQ